MNYIDLSKKVSKYLIISFVAVIVSIAMSAVGGVNYDKHKTVGLLLIIFGILLFVSSLVFMVVYTLRKRTVIKQLMAEEFCKKINIRENKSSFIDLDNQKCEFSQEGLYIDGIKYDYKDISSSAILKISCHLMYDEYNYYVCIKKIDSSEDDELAIIEMDGDILDLIKQKEIVFESETLLKQVLNDANNIFARSVTLTNIFSGFISFEDFFVVEKPKKKHLSIIMLVITFLLIIGVNFLLIWLTNSKKGIEFSSLVGFKLIVKIGLSVVVIIFAFYHNDRFKPSNLATKIILIGTLATYWVVVLTATKYSLLLMFIVCNILFIAAAVSFYLKKDKNDQNHFRLLLIGLLFSLSIAINVFEINFVDDLIFLISGISAGVVLLIVLFLGLIYYLKKRNVFDKKTKISYWFSIIFAPIIIGFIYSYLFVGIINYSFSNSYVYQDYVIKDKRISSGKYTTYYVKVQGIDKNINVNSEDYYKFNVGDTITLVYYEGALGLGFYKYKANE